MEISKWLTPYQTKGKPLRYMFLKSHVFQTKTSSQTPLFFEAFQLTFLWILECISFIIILIY